jgi:nucleotide-binding universal stress UspA family protein
MFSTVLLATDLSPASQAVIQTAASLKVWGTQKVILLQCLNLQDIPEEVIIPSRDFLIHNLDDQKALLIEQGLRTETEVRTGLAKIEINRAADDHKASLIVVGAHGQSFARELFLGGVAGAVLQSATKPVLVIKTLDPETPKPALLDHLLFPTDFSKPAEHAVGYLKKLIQCGAKKVTLMHVQDRSRIDPHLAHRLPEFNTIDEDRLKDLQTALHEHADLGIETLLTYGHPVADILTAIRERSISLVVMASQGKGYLAEIFLGSVSHQVSRQSPASVLLIPTPRNMDSAT